MLGRDGRLINEQLRRLPEHPQEHSRGRAGSWSRAGFRESVEAAARGRMEGAEVPGAGKGHGDGLGNSSGQMDTQNLGRGGWKRLEKEDGKGLVVSAGGGWWGESVTPALFSPGASASGAASDHGQVCGPKLRRDKGRGQKTALCMPQGVSKQTEAEQGPGTRGHTGPGAATSREPCEESGPGEGRLGTGQQ